MNPPRRSLNHRGTDMATIPPGYDPAARERSERLMDDFARSTGLAGDVRPRRYLWTDAFAVCNYVGLHDATGEAGHLELAVRLAGQVHDVLGRHHPDDERTGWISGFSEEEGARRPTAGGLRIGKPSPERCPGEPPDPLREWDRDGQYYHYLTRWIHALTRLYRATGDEGHARRALDLAGAAHAGFVFPTDAGPRMHWKMSVDLSRPLVPFMGGHDPLDGFLTLRGLRAAALEVVGDALDAQIGELAAMCRGRRWATDDPLGIGGLLTDLLRARRLVAVDDGPAGDVGSTTRELAETLPGESLRSLRVFTGGRPLEAPAEHRLAFREFGLAIGLAAVRRLPPGVDEPGDPTTALRSFLRLEREIVGFWERPEPRRARTWTEHRDINQVMLATALSPGGYLDLLLPGRSKQE